MSAAAAAPDRHGVQKRGREAGQWRLFEEDIAIIARSTRSGSIEKIHRLMQRVPLLNVARVHRELPLSKPTIIKALRTLEKLNIVQEVSGKKWGQAFRYDRYLRILEQGTQPVGKSSSHD